MLVWEQSPSAVRRAKLDRFFCPHAMLDFFSALTTKYQVLRTRLRYTDARSCKPRAGTDRVVDPGSPAADSRRIALARFPAKSSRHISAPRTSSAEHRIGTCALLARRLRSSRTALAPLFPIRHVSRSRTGCDL